MHVSSAAVFLDRDGVINVDRGDYVKSWREFEFLPRVLEAFKLLATLPVRLVVVTNQSVVGRGIIPRAVLDDIHARMLHMISAAGGRVDRIYVCPHAPWDNCDCRKPKPGLLLQAQRELGIDMPRSYLVGDRDVDIQAGRAAGVKTILVSSARCGPDVPDVDYVADSLYDAALWLSKRIVAEATRPGAAGRDPNH